MQFLLICFLTMIGSSSDKVIEARFTDTPPRIDGIIEEVWQTADSAYDFVQHSPYEKSEPTEKTIVYLLQDEENLYIAYRCYAETNKPIACLTADEDHIIIGIDPFGSKSQAYFFTVYASGIRQDGLVYDDGRTMEHSWEGVWYRGVRLYDDHTDYEIKIPFKSIRYKKDLKEWGIQFHRYCAANRETAFWTEIPLHEDPMVSKYGSLKGINPRSTGYYFELYPEGFVRNDRHGEFEDTTKLSGSVNFKWDITPQTTINATVFPDFAQIESDPFVLNLSRYPTYLREQRPFFLEGMDIFRMPDFGDERGFYDKLDIFYTRRVGKSLNAEVVPIIGGLKATHKTEKWNFGILGAYTDSDSAHSEPERSFGVFRVKRKILKNSGIGMLFSGTAVNKDSFNYALGFDGVFRSGFNQVIMQAAISQRNDKSGWAVSTGYLGMVKNFLILSAAEVVNDSFDVSDIGFVPWAGLKKLNLTMGPYRTYKKSFLKTLFYGPSFIVVMEPGEEEASLLGGVTFNPNFRNNWGFNIEGYVGKAHEADTNYTYRSINLSSWGNILGQYLNFGGDYEYKYNYRRNYLANSLSSWFRIGYTIIDNIALSINGNEWFEWDTTGNLLAITSTAMPRVDVRFNADIMLSIFDQMVFDTPETEWGETNLISNRLGALFSWNFKPKSWIYIAVNDYNIEDENGQMEVFNRVAAVKAKYLLYF